MVELEDVRELCLGWPGVSESFPFGEDVLVFKVMGKVFFASNLEAYPSAMNLKCDPERALELREAYASVKPGHHMNKKHWNTVTLDGDVPDEEMLDMLRHSYDLVVAGLRKKDREALQNMPTA